MNKLILVGFWVLLAVFGASAQTKSIYTSLAAKDCKTLEQEDDGAGWYRGECKGFGGFKLQLTEGDLRQSVDVISPKGKKFELNFGTISSAFSSVGEKAEWRVKNGKPSALIVRFSASENPDDSTKITSYLVVVKVSAQSVCVTDVVKPSKTQNADAQKLADNAATKPCRSVE